MALRPVVRLGRDASEEIRGLLQGSEIDAPAAVYETARFFIEHGAWFQLSRNSKVMSCRDAAQRRYRLGHRGIPLADELRSYVAEGTDTAGKRIYVLLHCRGDTFIDFDAVQRLPKLNQIQLSRADFEEFDDESPIGYGLINPFVAPRLLMDKGRVLQVFDPGVLDGSGETGTMMTNAGDKTWAVEFDPRDIVNPGFGDVARIVSASPRRHEEDSRTIGILTGNAPESGALLWRKINRAFRYRRGDSFRGDASYPRVLVTSLPAMGWSMELSTRDARLRPSILAEARQLAERGAQVIAFACNTTQYYQPEIERVLVGTDAQFVSLSKTVSIWLERNRKHTAFVAAIGNVTSDAGWSAFPFLHEMDNVRLPLPRESRLLEELAYQVKSGEVDHHTYQRFRVLIRDAQGSAVLLLLTELSIIFEKYPRSPLAGRKIIDAMDLYAESVVDAAICD